MYVLLNIQDTRKRLEETSFTSTFQFFIKLVNLNKIYWDWPAVSEAIRGIPGYIITSKMFKFALKHLVPASCWILPSKIQPQFLRSSRIKQFKTTQHIALMTYFYAAPEQPLGLQYFEIELNNC